MTIMVWKGVFLALVGGIAAPHSVQADLTADLRACGLTRGEKGFVSGVIDGDTLVLKSGREVRLVGLQAPKLPLGRANFEPWPLGTEAKAALEDLVLRREVRLFYGGARLDRHERVLAHVVAADDAGAPLWIERALLERGLARVYSFADNRACVGEMLGFERRARARRAGIWADFFYAIRDHRRTGGSLGSFQLVEGQVLDVAEVRTGVYLNFEENWREDFTVFIPKRDLRRFGGKDHELGLLEGRTIRVRGWLKLRNGPMIDVSHPEQIELVDE